MDNVRLGCSEHLLSHFEYLAVLGIVHHGVAERSAGATTSSEDGEEFDWTTSRGATSPVQSYSRKDEKDIPLKLVDTGDMTISDPLLDLLQIHGLLDDLIIVRCIRLNISEFRAFWTGLQRLTFLTPVEKTPPC